MKSLLWFHRRRTSPSTLPLPATERPARVFLAGPDAGARQELAAVLRRDGYEVTEAGGSELLGRLRAQAEGYQEMDPADLIIWSADATGHPDLAALRALRRVDWVSPIILLGSPADSALAASAARLGVTSMMPLPVNLEALRAEVAGRLPPG